MTENTKVIQRMYQIQLTTLQETIEQLTREKQSLERQLKEAQVVGYRPKKIMRLCMPKSLWK